MCGRETRYDYAPDSRVGSMSSTDDVVSRMDTPGLLRGSAGRKVSIIWIPEGCWCPDGMVASASYGEVMKGRKHLAT